MINLGRKEKNYNSPEVAGSSKSKVIRYPSFNVNDIALPLGSKHVGKTIEVKVMLRVNKAGPEIDEYSDNPNKKKHRAEFSVLGLDFKKNKVNIKDMKESDLDELEKSEHGKLSLIGR